MGTRLFAFMEKLLKKTLHMDYGNLESASAQHTIGKGNFAISSNGNGVEGLSRSSFELFTNLFGMLTYASIMASIHWSILLIVLVVTIITFLFKRHAIKYSDTMADKRYHANRVCQSLRDQGISKEYGKDIRIYHVETWFGKIFEEQIQKLTRIHFRQEIHWYFSTAAEQAGTVIRDLVLYFLLIHMVLDGDLSVAEFTFDIGIVYGFSSWMNNCLTKVSEVILNSKETDYYRDAIKIPDMFSHGKGEKPDLSAEVEIEFQDVSFWYDEEKPVLDHVSFHIYPGEKIALVGNNGAGKTTIVKLLCGFCLPQKGRILVNGIDTRDYDMDAYGQLISPVFQDGYLSAFSLADNIMGAEKEEENKRKKMWACLDRAGIRETVEALSKKEDTSISQIIDKDGVEFSGGEIQKLLIARALYKDGRLLILDEPTAALDPIAEKNIYEQYHKMTAEKTSLFISHRLASTRFCDRILYLENGRIAEEGSHEELLDRGGAYAGIFEIQSHYYKKEKGGRL